MNCYKKIPLKFSHQRAGCELRHVETLKARESSRFKRLSMVRSIDDCDLLNEDSMESQALPSKPLDGIVEVSKDNAKASNDLSSSSVADLSCKPENNSKATSERKAIFRKEMLFKWQQEKLMKKEIENKMKRKPFYVGVCQPVAGNNIKTPQNLKPSVSEQTKSFVSKIAKNRIVTHGTSVPPPQSRIPYNFKAASTVAKAANAVSMKTSTIKKPYTTASQNIVFEHKPSSVHRNTHKINLIAPVKKNLAVGIKPKNDNCQKKISTQPNSVQNNIHKINLMAPVKKNTAVGIKPKNDNCQKKISTQFGLVSRNASNIKNPAPTKKNENFTIRPPNQISSIPKSGLRIQNKVTTLPQKVTPAISRPASNIKTIHKTSTIPSKVKVVKGKCQNFEKCDDTATMRQNAVSTFKEKDKANPPDEKFKKPEGNICSTKELLSEQSDESASDAIFHCDVSVITPKSFAPEGFKFQPPILHSFFEDDLYEIFEQAKQNYSRTSTPTKYESGKTSSFPSKELNDSLKKESEIKEPESISDELCELSANIPNLQTNVSNDNHGYDPSNAKYHKNACEKFIEKESINHVLVNDSKDKTPCELPKNNSGMGNALNVSLLFSTSPPEMPDFDEIKEIIKDQMQNVDNENRDQDSNLFVNKNDAEDSLKNDGVVCTIINKAGDKDNVKVMEEDILKENISKDYDLLSKPCIIEAGCKIAAIESMKINIKKDAKDNSKDKVAVENLNAELEQNNSEEVSQLVTGKDKDMYSIVQSVSSEIDSKIVSKENFKAVACELPKNNSGMDNASNMVELFNVSPPEMPDFAEIKEIIKHQMQNIENERKDQDADIVSKGHENLNNKSTGVVPKRVSMFKRVSVLNSITETDDINDSATETFQNSQIVGTLQPVTPRRSARLARLLNESNTKSVFKKDTLLQNCTTDSKTFQRTPKRSQNSALTSQHSLKNSHSNSKHTVHKNSPKERNNCLVDVPTIPRRSMRLQKTDHDISESQIEDILSPFEDANCRTPRRSMRLINLNYETPKSGTCFESTLKSNLTLDFQRLKIDSENMDPSDLIDLNSSPEPLVSKKVSLLYTPQKRRSMRKSVKGDLMSFSPAGN